VGNSIKPAPGSPDHFENIGEQGKMGVTATQNIAAFNPATGELAWVAKFDGTTNGGNLVTAGNVLFQAIRRDFHVLDATSGRSLATVPLATPMGSTPLTYQADGKQFVAIASGRTVVAIGLP
jgi:outer membrane protein assembly factor BamB